MNPTVMAVTRRIRDRSAKTRGAYLERVEQAGNRPRGSDRMGCANVAHAFAGFTSLSASRQSLKQAMPGGRLESMPAAF